MKRTREKHNHYPRIQNRDFGFELGPRVFLAKTLVDKCPGCDTKLKIDFSRDPLNYPTPGEPIINTFECSDCDLEWDVETIIQIKLEIIK